MESVARKAFQNRFPAQSLIPGSGALISSRLLFWDSLTATARLDTDPAAEPRGAKPRGHSRGRRLGRLCAYMGALS